MLSRSSNIVKLSNPSKILTRSLHQSIIRLNAHHDEHSIQHQMANIYGHPKEGVYSNLPFQVKNRKYIPFSVWYWGVLGFFFAFPALSSFWQMKKAGSFNTEV
ncbi:unnamed protein product [Candida verbasci]|uniref:Uncharacterized protein n=1 Tax=Candida verbasci TaxID=1227364 RepID=A0A9W4TSV2_9ASCO|nr:unnamed protein product [Candida verbasci]